MQDESCEGSLWRRVGNKSLGFNVRHVGILLGKLGKPTTSAVPDDVIARGVCNHLHRVVGVSLALLGRVPKLVVTSIAKVG